MKTNQRNKKALIVFHAGVLFLAGTSAVGIIACSSPAGVRESETAVGPLSNQASPLAGSSTDGATMETPTAGQGIAQSHDQSTGAVSDQNLATGASGSPNMEIPSAEQGDAQSHGQSTGAVSDQNLATGDSGSPNSAVEGNVTTSSPTPIARAFDAAPLPYFFYCLSSFDADDCEYYNFDCNTNFMLAAILTDQIDFCDVLTATATAPSTAGFLKIGVDERQGGPSWIRAGTSPITHYNTAMSGHLILALPGFETVPYQGIFHVNIADQNTMQIFDYDLWLDARGNRGFSRASKGPFQSAKCAALCKLFNRI